MMKVQDHEEYKKLKLELAICKEQLKQYTSIEKKSDYSLVMDRFDKIPSIPILFQSYKDFHGITITIDQSKYSLLTYSIEELYGVIYNAIMSLEQFCSFLYFCYEHTKVGIPHAHLMVQYKYGYDYTKVRDIILPMLSDNKKNYSAFHDEGNATSSWHTYINKDCPNNYPKYWLKLVQNNWIPPAVQTIANTKEQKQSKKIDNIYDFLILSKLESGHYLLQSKPICKSCNSKVEKNSLKIFKELFSNI